MIGQTISHYKILEKLGEGGMGVIYKAEDILLKRIVALKFLPTHLTNDAEARQRFIHEAQAASALDHPNICTIYEIGTTNDGQMFIAMAYYQGKTLKEKIAEGVLSIDEAVDIASQVGRGLSKAHSIGIVHRDIKPTNLIITEDGIVKILDFGLAKLKGRTQITKPGTTVGTLAYMSPEQASGEEVDQRTDIWSLGVVFYEMLTGQCPFNGEFEAAILYSILNEKPKPLGELNPNIPDGLKLIVEKAITKELESRYQAVDIFLSDLKEFGAQILPQSGNQASKRDWRRRNTLISIVVIVLAMIIAILFRDSLMFWHTQPSLESTSHSPRDQHLKPDTLLLLNISSDSADLQSIYKQMVDFKPEMEKANYKLDPISDSTQKTLNETLMSEMISTAYPEYVVVTQADVEKQYARIGKVVPHYRMSEDSSLLSFSRSVGCLACMRTFAYRIAPNYAGSEYYSGYRVLESGHWYGDQRFNNIDEVVRNITSSIRGFINQRYEPRLSVAILSTDGEKVILKKSQSSELRIGFILSATRLYSTENVGDSGYVERLNDLRAGIRYYESLKSRNHYLSKDDSMAYVYAVRECKAIQKGTPGWSNCNFSLGYGIRVTDVFDSTAMGVIIERKFPWMTLRSGDECELKRDN